MPRYKVTKEPHSERKPEDWSAKLPLWKATKRAANFAERQGLPAKLWLRGKRDETYSRRQKGGVRKKARQLLRAGKIGDELVVESVTGRKIWVKKVRWIRPYKLLPLPGNARAAHPLIADVYRFVHYTFPFAQDWGTENCRLVRGSFTTWSQHSRWSDGVRATDVGVASKAEGDKVHDAVKKKYGDKVTIFWWGEGAGGHFDHNHIEINPAKTGTPVCAGGSS